MRLQPRFTMPWPTRLKDAVPCIRGPWYRLDLMQADMKDLNKGMTALEIDVALLLK
jgi:hypothetical protein